MTAPTAMSTGELLERLRRHYIKPGQALPGGMFLPEVTYGRAGGSRCDAIYVGFTASSGRILVGHELKVSRADWRHELDQPGKADTWADECHAWYVVAPSTHVVPPEELPAGWGLMVPSARTKTRMETIVAARQHLDRTPSWTATRSLLSRADTLRAASLADMENEAYRKASEQVEKLVEQEVARRTRFEPDIERLRAERGAIEEALGLRLDLDSGRSRYRYGCADEITLDELRDAAAFLRAHRDVDRALAALNDRYVDPLNSARRLLDDLAGAIDGLKALAPEEPAEAAS